MGRTTPIIPVATSPGARPELSISKYDWRRVEAAYGFPLSASARKQIHEVTQAFLFSVEIEGVALPVALARQRIECMKKAAADFLEVILDNPQDGSWDARTYADRLLKKNFLEAEMLDILRLAAHVK